MTCEHCGTPLRQARSTSLALCRPCTERGRALFRASVADCDLSERQRRFNQFWGPQAGVLASLAVVA